MDYIEGLGATLHQMRKAEERLAELAKLEQDNAILDWIEAGNNSKDMGHYFEVRTGDTGGKGFREAVLEAMKRGKVKDE